MLAVEFPPGLTVGARRLGEQHELHLRARVPMTPMVLCGVDCARLAWRGRPCLPCGQAPLEKLVGGRTCTHCCTVRVFWLTPHPTVISARRGATVYTHSNRHAVSCKQVVPVTTPALPHLCVSHAAVASAASRRTSAMQSTPEQTARTRSV